MLNSIGNQNVIWKVKWKLSFNIKYGSQFCDVY